jgi:hypothetical protein
MKDLHENKNISSARLNLFNKHSENYTILKLIDIHENEDDRIFDAVTYDDKGTVINFN